VVGKTYADGTINFQAAYDAFGNQSSSTNGNPMPVDYTWDGLQKDQSTGLVNDRAREYDPATGRPLQRDPLGFAAGDSNLYRYVNNEPTNATDPSGDYIYFESQQDGERWIAS